MKLQEALSQIVTSLGQIKEDTGVIRKRAEETPTELSPTDKKSLHTQVANTSEATEIKREIPENSTVFWNTFEKKDTPPPGVIRVEQTDPNESWKEEGKEKNYATSYTSVTRDGIEYMVNLENEDRGSIQFKIANHHTPEKYDTSSMHGHRVCATYNGEFMQPEHLVEFLNILVSSLDADRDNYQSQKDFIDSLPEKYLNLLRQTGKSDIYQKAEPLLKEWQTENI